MARVDISILFVIVIPESQTAQTSFKGKTVNRVYFAFAMLVFLGSTLAIWDGLYGIRHPMKSIAHGNQLQVGMGAFDLILSVVVIGMVCAQEQG